MSASVPLVGTVILNYRSTEDTLACLAAVLASTELDQRIIVADNTEDAAEQRRLQAALPPNVDYLALGANVGYAAGNNAAIARLIEAGARYLWVLNPDARVTPTTLRDMLATLRKHGDIGILGPRIVHGDGGSQRIMSDGGRVSRDKFGRTWHDNSTKTVGEAAASLVRVDYVTGACVLLDVRVVRTIGLLPEKFFLYFEETEFCRRAIEYGWAPSVDRRVVVAHYRRSSGSLPSASYLYYMIRNRALFVLGLGIEDPQVVQRAYDDLHETFIDPWRARVERNEAAWLPVFDRLVTQAKLDGHASVTGPVDLDRIVGRDSVNA